MQSKILTSFLHNGWCDSLISQSPLSCLHKENRNLLFRTAWADCQMHVWCSYLLHVWHSDAVNSAVIYWPVRCLSTHLAEAWEGQRRLSALPEGRRAVIWAAFQYPGPACYQQGCSVCRFTLPWGRSNLLVVNGMKNECCMAAALAWKHSLNMPVYDVFRGKLHRCCFYFSADNKKLFSKMYSNVTS